MTGPFDIDLLTRGAAELGVSLDPRQCAAIIKYCELLADQNTRVNLTSVPAEKFIAVHILDSLALCRAIDLSKCASLIDVGTGAGLPGVPLAIAFPALQVTLVESIGKKAAFVSEAIGALNINNAKVVHSRAEAAAHQREYREKFLCATARAVAPLGALAELMLPFLAVGGVAVAFKGPNFTEELWDGRERASKLGGTLREPIEVAASSLEARRLFFITIDKHAPTPVQYPRPNARQ